MLILKAATVYLKFSVVLIIRGVENAVNIALDNVSVYPGLSLVMDATKPCDMNTDIAFFFTFLCFAF